MSSGTNTERITQNNGIISENNVDLESLKTRIQNLPTRAVTQTKSVTITENGTTTVEPDTGYDGLSSVEVVTNVSGGGSEYNAVFRIRSGDNVGLVRMLIEAPMFDFSMRSNLSYFFNDCSSLEVVPVFDTSRITNFSNAFSGCTNLNNNSLNNILQMCINATAYNGTKTLKQLGLTSGQATRCQSLSNWEDFVNAGWTSGY